MASRRKFSPIFAATVTFGDQVTVSDTKTGVVCAHSECRVTVPDGKTVSRTVKAFGNQLMSVQPHFVPGSTVALAVQYDGGTLKVVGYPRPKGDEGQVA